MMEFDFDKDVEKMLPKLMDDSFGNKLGDKKHRIIVCTHWLLGLCHSGINCTFLHRLDKSKMPLCKHLNLCKIKNCPLKHVAEEELEECLFYKQGFCYNGPKCGRRHIKRTPEECPMEAIFDTNNTMSILQGGNKKLKTTQPNDNFKVTLCTHWLLNGTCPFNNDCHYAHGEDQINEGYQPNVEFLQDGDIYDPTSLKMEDSLNLPYPTTSKLSYFILQSPDLRALNIAKQKGIWAIPLRMVAEINAAFRSSDQVILYMCVRPLRGIYGIAKLPNLIPLIPASNIGPNMHMSVEFPITWLKSFRLSLRTVAQLKLGMTGMFVGRSSADGRFDNKVGLDILATIYRKSEWDWSKEMQKAEANIRIIDPSKGGIGGVVGGGDTLGEYYPQLINGLPGSMYLSPDTLFPVDWIERASIVPNEKVGSNISGSTMISNKSFNNKVTTNINTANTMSQIPDFYTGSLPGFVFCAITPVIEEMLARRLLGLPFQMKDVVIHPNVPLFIFDSMAQVLLGIFHADSPTSMNIEPSAFIQWLGMGPGGCSPLPIQLRFRIAIEIPPTSIQDPELLVALGDASKSLGGVLGIIETKNVANLLAKKVLYKQMLASGALSSNNNNSSNNINTTLGHLSSSSLTTTTTNTTSLTGGKYYQPPFPHNEKVFIDIVGSIYEIKKRLLGI